jgi:phosphoglycerate kinase
MEQKTVREVDVAGKRVLLRADFNVPLVDGHVGDDVRLLATLPTIRYLKKQGARVVLCSHLGRPGGKVDEKARLGPVAQRLSLLLGAPVGYLRECIGPEVKKAVAAMKAGEVVLLENLRFHPEEERNDPTFAASLASLGDLFVDDAFSAAHRAHASIVGVPQFLPAVAGLLMEREVEALGRVLQNPARPFATILGGAKVSDKIGVLENLFLRVDLFLIGGGMAATFFRALGYEVGDSLVEEERVKFAGKVIADAQVFGVKLLLPQDVMVAREFHAESAFQVVRTQEIPKGWRIVDIGPWTTARFRQELQACRMVLWNGPMGVFEIPAFARGTRELAQAIAELKGVTTVVGGGSTAEIVTSMGLADRMTLVSTGGGASLEFLEGRELPGVAALLKKEKGLRGPSNERRHD